MKNDEITSSCFFLQRWKVNKYIYSVNVLKYSFTVLVFNLSFSILNYFKPLLHNTSEENIVFLLLYLLLRLIF